MTTRRSRQRHKLIQDVLCIITITVISSMIVGVLILSHATQQAALAAL